MFWPIRTAGSYPPVFVHATRVVALPLGKVWAFFAEQSISHTRNMWTVKATYWDRFFFCRLIRWFSVSCCLGCPSGVIRGMLCWKSVRRGLGSCWPRFWIPVSVNVSKGQRVRLNPPRQYLSSSAQTGSALIRISRILQKGIGGVQPG